MEKRNIGTLDVSVVGLGTNNFGTDFFGNGCDERETAAIVDAALDSGINFFDTAEEYSVASSLGTGRSEQFLGAALRSRRDEVVIATKFMVENPNEPGVRGAERIERAVEGSLKRLGTDYIDLLQQHYPDPDTPTEEILETLDRLVQAGKVREIGCSNFSGRMIEDADDTAAKLGTARFQSAQNRLTVLDAAPQAKADGAPAAEEGGSDGGESAEKPEGFVEACIDRGLMLIPYFPLASGLLTGKYNRGEADAKSRLASDAKVSKIVAELELSERNLETARALEAYAREHRRSLVELAISWLACKPVVASVIAGATRPEQVRANAGSAGWALGEDDLAEIEAIVAA